MLWRALKILIFSMIIKFIRRNVWLTHSPDLDIIRILVVRF